MLKEHSDPLNVLFSHSPPAAGDENKYLDPQLRVRDLGTPNTKWDAVVNPTPLGSGIYAEEEADRS